MSKWQKMLIIVFCVGVLLCGLGSGIFFTEFSGLKFGGEQIIGPTDMRTDDFYVEFEPGEEAREIVGIYPRYEWDILTDNSVPDNTVHFCATYNAELIKPWAYWNEDNENIVFGYNWQGSDGTEIAYMMEAKDVVLQNLKEGKIVSFDTVELEEVTVLVNSRTRDKIKLHY